MKKFLIIGNCNAISYKEMFPLIVKKEVFVRTSKGTNHMGMWFHTNSGELKEAPSVWFTTLDSKHLYKTLELTKTYDPEKYPVYDNYNAIEVSCLKNMPKDYDGVMGVPISIVLFSPEQFEIVGCTYSYGVPTGWDINTKMGATINGKNIFKRLLIKSKQ